MILSKDKIKFYLKKINLKYNMFLLLVTIPIIVEYLIYKVFDIPMWVFTWIFLYFTIFILTIL